MYLDIKAVGFDLDDTLYDRYLIYENVFKIMEEKVHTLGITFHEFNNVFQNYSLIEFDLFTLGKKSKHQYKIDRVKLTYNYFGVQINDNQAIWFNQLYQHFRNKIILRENVIELLDKLSLNTNLELFVLTNGPSKDQREKIGNLGLNKYFKEKNLFISDEIGIAKPEIRIFKEIEKTLGCKGENILYIGDNYYNDIVASYRSNWNPVFYNFENKSKFNLEKIENIFVGDSFYDIENIIINLGLINN